MEEMHELPPHARAIGMELVDVSGRKCIVKVPYAEHLVGDPDTGTIHGGVITAALDNTCGWSIRCHEDWQENVSMATLDIRIDYMRPAAPHEDLLVEAECYKITRSVAFVRAHAHQGDAENPVATCVGAFMVGTPNTKRT